MRSKYDSDLAIFRRIDAWPEGVDHDLKPKPTMQLSGYVPDPSTGLLPFATETRSTLS